MNDLETTFGEQSVTPAERKKRIARVFALVAPRYDLMNDLMSFGIHRLWKHTMVKTIALSANDKAIDLAGGTGDVARAIAKKTGNSPVVIDASTQMMVQGRKDFKSPVTWVAADGEHLPLPDSSVDLVTLSFGLRNMTSVEKALVEIHRCLKPGGRFICLEFSKPVFWLKPFYDLYSRIVIPRLGALVAREPSAYQYLIESIRKFPDQHELCAIMKATGFRQVRFENLSFGISALHFGRKPSEKI
jgi:demethylmenaquinone methyltransferase/2-methoxy-6-polyprenyl-1,4-benzoquinol methylase